MNLYLPSQGFFFSITSVSLKINLQPCVSKKKEILVYVISQSGMYAQNIIFS